ncbi:unnamed protein product (macronuclear) [Paramecium tetraurelia]|uniref:Uncharacterized protein n=1 Tax=Paramecium tetraurelia TaxID=5888 RepID=A0DSP9_PARTE|nr:uncharacterized protein GSPATT00019759001 [Paramecium tetraurelia]CAK86066.1 unnamed protein product [Paramecium tetraurelia]|eukprot:XP_001453463.1 hypothetical protein (macronuclear) [Paramecium tetraurelia strain d4-2]
MRKNIRLSTDLERQRIASNISIKSINSTTINTINTTNDGTLPRLESNHFIKSRVKRSSHQIRFKRSPMKMSQPNNMLESQSIKQSSKILLNSVVFELDKLAIAAKHKSTKSQDILNLSIDLMNMLGSDYDRIEIYLIVLQNKCKSQCVSLGLLFTFLIAIIQETYGHNRGSLQQYRYMNDMANKHQLFQCKMMVYYRIGLLLNRLRQFEKLLVIGKKLLKLSWYYSEQEYELKAYYLISKGYNGIQDMEMSVIFMNRYLDGVLQQNDHIKNIGMQQITLYHRRTQEPRHKSPSSDDFNLEMFRQKIERNYIKMKMIGGKLSFKLQSSECDICAQYGKNCERIQTEDEHPYKKNMILHTDSRNRDLIGYFDSEQIQQMYIPAKTLPILKQLILKFISYI